MALFRRKKQAVTPEFQEYYQTQSRKSGAAWGMAVVAIIIGALLILGLFFGGRWTYRKIANKDDKPATTTGNTDLIGGNAQVLKTPSATTPPAKAPTATPTPPATAPTPQPAKTTPTPTPAKTPAAAPAALPNTGPDEDL